MILVKQISNLQPAGWIQFGELGLQSSGQVAGSLAILLQSWAAERNYGEDKQ